MTPELRLQRRLRCFAFSLALIGVACTGRGGPAARTPTSAPPPTATPVMGALYQDTFTDPGSGWPKVDQDHSRSGYHPPDFYHLEVSAPNDRLAILGEQVLSDATVETEVRVDHTDSQSGDFRYGLALRSVGENQYYAFTISPRTKTWQVAKHTTEGVAVLAKGTDQSIQGLTAADVLRVDAGGPDFTFHINDHVVGRLHDSDYASGKAGFVVETLDETLAHIHYDSLTMREVVFPSVLHLDDFTDPNSGWPAEAADSYKYGYHPPDFFHVEVSVANSWRAAFRGLSFDDLTAETEVLADHIGIGGGEFRYGLAVRRVAEDRYYAFTVSPRTQTWQVLKRSPDGVQVLAEGTDVSIQGLVARDQLRVDASGARFTFHINGRVVTQVSDPDYDSGDVGFYAETFAISLAHVHYESLTIREVELLEVAVTPTATPEPTATPVLPTPTPIPLPPGMALIPAGYFQMGSSTGPSSEKPEHPVLLDAFYMDLVEVTNVQYRECVSAAGCTPGNRRSSFTHTGYRDDPAYDDYPMIGVTWDQTDTYCRWAGKRLPTEAEWEYAASGPDNYRWPWGDEFDPSLSAASAPDVQPVGSYPDGVSPFGVFDMAGNVTEWVADVYDSAFYANSPASNPRGEGEGSTRIYRGGSFANADGLLYITSRRYPKSRSLNDVDVGFRCAKDAAEVTASTPPEAREALVKEFCQVYAAYKPDAPCP